MTETVAPVWVEAAPVRPEARRAPAPMPDQAPGAAGPRRRRGRPDRSRARSARLPVVTLAPDPRRRAVESVVEARPLPRAELAAVLAHAALEPLGVELVASQPVRLGPGERAIVDASADAIALVVLAAVHAGLGAGGGEAARPQDQRGEGPGERSAHPGRSEMSHGRNLPGVD